MTRIDTNMTSLIAKTVRALSSPHKELDEIPRKLDVPVEETDVPLWQAIRQVAAEALQDETIQLELVRRVTGDRFTIGQICVVDESKNADEFGGHLIDGRWLPVVYAKGSSRSVYHSFLPAWNVDASPDGMLPRIGAYTFDRVETIYPTNLFRLGTV